MPMTDAHARRFADAATSTPTGVVLDLKLYVYPEESVMTLKTTARRSPNHEAAIADFAHVL